MDLGNLKAAIRALMAAQSSTSEDDGYHNLRWIIADLRRMVVDETIWQKSMEEGQVAALLNRALVEAGAKLSKDSRAQIEQAIAALNMLLTEPDPETPTESIRQAILPEVPELSEAEPSDDWVAKKIPVIKKERPNAKDSQVQAIAYSMCKADVSVEDVTGELIDEYAAKLGMTLEESTPAEPKGVPGIIEPGTSTFVSPVTILGEAKDSGGRGDRFDVVVIRAGMSHNRVMYKPEVLEKSIALLEGRPMYIDHPEPGTARSIRDKVGWYENVRYDPGFAEATGAPGVAQGAIIATLNLYRNSGSPWFREMVNEAIERGRPQDIGVSILAGGKTNIKRDQGGIYKEVEEITVYASADAVAEPGAGGRPLSLVASAEKDHDVDVLKEAKTLQEILDALPELSMQQIREARPDLFLEDGKPNWQAGIEAPKPEPTPTEPIKETTPPAEIDVAEAINAGVQAGLKPVYVQQTKDTASRLLRESRLPSQLWEKVYDRIGDNILAESDIRTIIGDFEDILAKAQPADPVSAGGYPRGSLVVPYGSIKEGLAPVDLVQAALDDWFGEEVDEKFKGKFNPIRSMTQFYVDVTGDVNFDGMYHPENSVIREALPTAAALIGSPPQGGGVTFSGLFGTSMNRRLLRMYRNQNKWWEPIVQKTRLDNMKQQDRVVTHTFGSLTERTEDGVEYTELTWGETVENWTPTEYGNVVTFGRRAVINDDLSGLRRLPQYLARSAGITINEYVSNLFTQNSGNGPVLADAVQVFNAAGHQGNRVTTPFSREAVLDLRKVIMKMTDQSGKRLDLIPRILLVPVDLEVDAWELVSTQKVPESANNAENILSRSDRGIQQVITVPQWTDTNNWYLMCNPNDPNGGIETIELGFLFGREEPELLSQVDPTSGLVWTNDVSSHKVRWDFGGDWVEYRGAAAAIVA